MKKIFLVIWGDPKFYQTLIFLSQKFSKDKFKVFILSRNLDNITDVVKQVDFGKNVKLLKSPIFLSHRLHKINYTIFNFYILVQIILKKPCHLIFFNKKALFNILLAKILRKKINFIYHNFDFELLDKTKKLKEKLLIKLEFFCSRFCNHIVFPSKERAKLFRKFSGNKLSKYHSLMNCFPKNFKIKRSSKFDRFLYTNNLRSKYIICHLGSIGPNHYLEEIIDSFKFINDKFILIVAGSSIDGFAKKLKTKIIKNELKKKVFIFENISNQFWFGILKRSNLGLSFYKQNSLSHKFMAGTSQKFNNYLFSNTPMIVNNTLNFNNFKKKFDIFEITNPRNSKKISEIIFKTLSNRSRYNKIKKNMKIVFLKDLNFEYQFKRSYKKIL